MAFKLAEAYVELSERGFRGVNDAVQGITTQFSGLRGVLGGVSSLVPGIGAALASLGAGAGVAGMIRQAAAAEQTAISFEVLLGSADAAKQMLAEINQFAAATPFEVPGLTQAAQTMLAFNIPAQSVMNDLSMISNVAMGNEQRLSSLALVYGQVASAGRLTGGDLLQLINVGFNPLQEIAKRTGESMSELRDRMSDGRVSFDEVRQAFVDATSEGGKFYQMNEKQSGTLAGLWSTLQDGIGMALRDIGEMIVEAFDLKGVISSVSEFADVWREQWLPEIRSAIETAVEFGAEVWKWAKLLQGVVPIALGVVAVMGTISVAQKAIAAGQAMILALSGPKGWAVLAAGTAIGAAAVGYAKSQFDELAAAVEKSRTETNKQADSMREVAAAAGEARDSVKDLNEEALRAKMAEAGKGYLSLRDKLDQEIIQLQTGASKEEMDIRALGLEGIDPGKADILRAMVDQRDALKADRDRDRDLARGAESINERDPLTGLQPQLDALQEMKRRELISEEQYWSERDRLRASALGVETSALDQWRNRMDEIRRFAEEGLISGREREQLEESALPRSIASLLDSLKTPAEKLAERLDELRQFRDSGAITDEQFAAASAKLQEDAAQAEKEQRSSGGFVGLADYAKRIQDSAAREQTELLRRSVAVQEEIRDGMAEMEPGPARAGQ